MWPVRFRCIDCMSDELSWRPASGRGAVYTFTIIHQVFHPGFADGGAKAANLGGIAGQCRRVVVLTTEVLPDHVLRPAGDQFLVAQVEGVLEIEQRRHQPDRQTRPAGGTDTGAGRWRGRGR